MCLHAEPEKEGVRHDVVDGAVLTWCGELEIGLEKAGVFLLMKLMGGHHRGADARGVLREGTRAREHLHIFLGDAFMRLSSAHGGFVLILFRFVIAPVN